MSKDLLLWGFRHAIKYSYQRGFVAHDFSKQKSIEKTKWNQLIILLLKLRAAQLKRIPYFQCLKPQ
jgi:hypothetical protein